MFLAVVAGTILALMVLQLARALQESRSARAGFITFGGDDRYQARNVHRDVHDSLMIARVQLVFCRTVSRDVFPRNRYLPIASELTMLAFLGRHLLRRAPDRSPLYDDKAQIRRFYVRQDLATIRSKADALRLNYMFVLIAMQVRTVMQRMHRTRLRVTLPASFADDGSFNTVGAILLDIDAEPDLDAMARKIRRLVKRGQWQVAATKHIQRIFPTRRLSQRARNLVDLTLTVVPQKTLPHNMLSQEMKGYEFTMGNIQYPVYAMAFIFEDHVHTSFMVNTPAFDADAFMAEDGAAPMNLMLQRNMAE
jgi:hypothetical protein